MMVCSVLHDATGAWGVYRRGAFERAWPILNPWGQRPPRQSRATCRRPPRVNLDRVSVRVHGSGWKAWS